MEYRERYDNYRMYFEENLGKFLDGIKLETRALDESFRYSLSAGGKRIRPVMMYASAEMLGISKEEVTDYAVALELIHTYSLIHDDLPEMDNDDFRRGQPSCHKKFGAGNAVLAGDALLNTAYSILLKKCHGGDRAIKAATVICDGAGIRGMIAGQSRDLNPGAQDEEALSRLYGEKTSALITAALLVPSALAGDRCREALMGFGGEIGYLFQLTDDMLDVEGNFENLGKSIGKDAAEDKFTAVCLLGLDGCRTRADEKCLSCRKYLDQMECDTSFFRDLTEDVRSRVS